MARSIRISREQQQRWIEDIEKAAHLGIEAQHDWWAGIDEAQKEYCRGLVGDERLAEAGDSPEEHRVPVSQATLSPSAVQMLCDLDFEDWDRQIEKDDARLGKLSKLGRLAEKARRDHAAGRTTPL